jgi:putative ABC transport system permease protein
MSLTRLIFREILHRKFAFFAGVLSIAAVVAVIVAITSVMEVYQLRTDEYLGEQLVQTEMVMAENEDAYRKIGKMLSFNLLVLSADQDLNEYLNTGYISEDMPIGYVDQLADSDIDTVRHLLPTVERSAVWPERGDAPVVLAGSEGEITKTHGSHLPIMQPVAPGTVVLGYRLWSKQIPQVSVGDVITFQGEEYEVSACNSERGSRDDVTLWIDLKEAQSLLGAEGRIDAILALKCHCAGAEIPNIRREVEEILPGTQVIAFVDRVETRAAARDTASELTSVTMDSRTSEHEELLLGLAGFSSWFLPLLIVGACVWIGLLALLNVQQRTGEIGILRAIGFSTGKIQLLILGRLFLIGSIGGLIGYGLGAGIASHWCVDGEAVWLAEIVLRPSLISVSCLGAAILAVIAGMPPSVLAANRDPADVLRFDS